MAPPLCYHRVEKRPAFGQDMSVIKGLNGDDIKKAWTFLELISWRVLFLAV